MSLTRKQKLNYGNFSIFVGLQFGHKPKVRYQRIMFVNVNVNCCRYKGIVSGRGVAPNLQIAYSTNSCYVPFNVQLKGERANQKLALYIFASVTSL